MGAQEVWKGRGESLFLQASDPLPRNVTILSHTYCPGDWLDQLSIIVLIRLSCGKRKRAPEIILAY
jgi:hypothetical protein